MIATILLAITAGVFIFLTGVYQKSPALAVMLGIGYIVLLGAIASSLSMFLFI